MFNLVIVLILTLLVAMVLVYWIASHDRTERSKILDQGASTLANLPLFARDFKSFAKACLELTEYFKLEVMEVTQSGADEFSIRAQTVHPVTRVQYLLVGLYLHPTQNLDPQRVAEISEQVIAERLSKAIIFTTAKIDAQILSRLELAPISLLGLDEMQDYMAKSFAV